MTAYPLPDPCKKPPVKKKIEVQELTNELKTYIREHPELYLHPDNSGAGYVCPICGNGSHKANSRGLETRDGVHFSCFGSGSCFKSLDVIDIIALERGYASRPFPEKLRLAAEAMGLDTAAELPERAPRVVKKLKPKSQPAEFSFLQGQKALKAAPPIAVEYLKRRGISLETAVGAGVGFDPEWRAPNVPASVPPSPRLIFPTSTSSYGTRDLRNDADIPDMAKSYIKQKVGSAKNFFHVESLESNGPVFIVEGELDALSIIDVGGQAVALCSTSNAKDFVSLMKDKMVCGDHVPPLVISMDNDDAGKKASKELKDNLEKFSVPCIVANVSGTANDPNEALQRSREAFANAVRSATRTAAVMFGREYKESDFIETQQKSTDFSFTGNDAVGNEVPPPTDADAPDENETKTTGAIRLTDYRHTYRTHREQGFDPYKTGLDDFDKLIGGGLYPELYTFGAATGSGKTTFTLQIGNHIAKQGIPVLYTALEMSIDELIAKSISKLAYQKVMEVVGNAQPYQGQARNTTDILWHSNDRANTEAIRLAEDEFFETYAPNITVLEGVGNIPASEVRKAAFDLADRTGKAPLVIVDYLQLLRAEDVHQTEKQAADHNITAMKQLSRDLTAPVFLISSLNRVATTDLANGGEITLESFKESGGIEYTSGVALGMKTGNADSRVMAMMMLLKHRHGKVFKDKEKNTVCFEFDGTRSIFKPWQDDDIYNF